MVKVLSVHRQSERRGRATAAAAPECRAVAQADDDPVEATKTEPVDRPGMSATSSRPARCAKASSSSARWSRKWTFPKFVGGLIKNVFQAIVESIIEQMRAYGELISNVAKTVDQFMTTTSQPGAGRDWLAEQYPDTFEVDVQHGAGGFRGRRPRRRRRRCARGQGRGSRAAAGRDQPRARCESPGHRHLRPATPS